MLERVPYSESCSHLQREGLLDAGEVPPLPARAPRHDDDVLGVSFFRTCIDEVTLDGLTLPRTFFGRTELRNVSFRGTDLSESTLNWNDLADVDFSGVDLTRADLRASSFTRCRFDDAILHQADLRHSKFDGCSFSGASLMGAKLVRSRSWSACLAREQMEAISWQADAGLQPEGG